jgi:hypothetical protein
VSAATLTCGPSIFDCATWHPECKPIGHSPYRAVVELFRDLFDWHISLGTVHNIVSSAVEPARAITCRYDLAGVRIGAHDEIFQAGQPVLVGVDTASTYCYLLSLEDHRDAETWGVRLLELVDQRLDPDATVADAGAGLRAGQAFCGDTSARTSWRCCNSS